MLTAVSTIHITGQRKTLSPSSWKTGCVSQRSSVARSSATLLSSTLLVDQQQVSVIALQVYGSKMGNTLWLDVAEKRECRHRHIQTCTVGNEMPREKDIKHNIDMAGRPPRTSGLGLLLL